MRKYDFRTGDIVREITVDKRPVVGKVIGFGSSAEHDYYKVSSKGDVYSAREDEIELVRRGPTKAQRAGLLDQFTLDWYGPDKPPAAGETCMIAWIGLDGIWREDVAAWNGEEWEFPAHGSEKAVRVGMDVIDAWAPWEWPDVTREGGADDGCDGDACEIESDADPDD